MGIKKLFKTRFNFEFRIAAVQTAKEISAASAFDAFPIALISREVGQALRVVIDLALESEGENRYLAMKQ